MIKMPKATDREAISIKLNEKAILKYHKSHYPEYEGNYIEELKKEFTQFFADHGMSSHPRYGFLSNGNMSFKEAESIAKAFARKYCWLRECDGIVAFNLIEVKGYMDLTDYFNAVCEEESK